MPISDRLVMSQPLADLMVVTTIIESIGTKLIVPRYIITNAEIITGWESEGRYDVHVVVRIDRLKKTYEVINDWFNELRKIGYKCFVPLMEKFNNTYGHYPKYPVADAGYGSYNNYLYCAEHTLLIIHKIPMMNSLKSRFIRYT